MAVSLKFCKNLSENKVLTISKHTTGETTKCALNESSGIFVVVGFNFQCFPKEFHCIMFLH